MTAPNEKSPGFFARFFHSEVTGSILLLVCAIVALVWANSPWQQSYHDISHTYLGVSWGDATFKLSLHHWINDGLMAVFFFVVGLEIKRELVVGELSSVKQAVAPMAAALGGMIAPALIYFAVNFGGEGANGWGIPMATDIAFALGILALFGSRVPISLKVFLTALAIVDDLGAVLVIALYYTTSIDMGALSVAGAIMVAIFIAGRLEVRNTGLYLLLAVAFWVAMYQSGIHTTVAGTLIALLVPVRARIEPSAFCSRVRDRLGQLDENAMTKESMIADRAQQSAITDIYLAAEDMTPPGPELEHQLHPLSTFFILPLFALFNAGVPIDINNFSFGTVGLGIIFGLVLGKQIGVMGFIWLAVRCFGASLPVGTRWAHLWGASCLAGVGFTMSLFISSRAFYGNETLDTQAKLGVLAASLLSGAIGYVVLHLTLPKKSAT